MLKLTRISDDKIPIGWKFDNECSPINDTGICIYRDHNKGVVIVQYDYTGGTEKLSVDSGLSEFKPLKNHLITVNNIEANKMALKVMEGLENN
jgi:hypothetical protein